MSFCSPNVSVSASTAGSGTVTDFKTSPEQNPEQNPEQSSKQSSVANPFMCEIVSRKLGGFDGEWSVLDVHRLVEYFRFSSVIGLQAGDEGKGHVAVELARRYKEIGYFIIVCGGSGGANAGHTLTHNGYKYNTNILPAAFMQGDLVFLGSNKLYNISSFRREIDRITTPRKDAPALTNLAELREKLVFDNTGKVTFCSAVLAEHINEFNKAKTTGGSVGTTGQGISTTISQFDVKCPIEIMTVFNSYKSKLVDEYLDEYYTISNTDTIINQYLELVKSGKLKAVSLSGVVLDGDSPDDVLQKIKNIDRENIEWFCSNFGSNFKGHGHFNKTVLDCARRLQKTFVVLEGVQANSLSPVNGPLNATTSSELNPDILMQIALKFCDFTTLALIGAKVSNVGVMKLIQSTVGHHHNPAKIRDYAKFLKLEFTNKYDPDGRVAELLKAYPAFGDYARLAVLTLDELRKTNPSVTPDFLLTDGVLDESALLSRYLGETGTTTGRVRELSWLDFNRINSCSFNQVMPTLALTRLDAYNIFNIIRICVGYQIDGVNYMFKSSFEHKESMGTAPKSQVFSSYKDFTSGQMMQAVPLYVEFDSWDGQVDLTLAKSYNDLPREARNVIEFIQKQFGEVMSCNLSARETLFL
ncbi:adenylosuccinate synthase [Yasminevirus sp. GU-2018]|uniref:Adenylosuccinate synthase n=1 Tax=Yasminevirus sp. GU-2018 TaxID=2420051 RepID=A0A5K0U9K9_9VIRU|nr:adenylosuccinate synthase [Yasminevirus sp. GU-2018]